MPPLSATRALRSIKRPPLPVVRRLAAAPSSSPSPSPRIDNWFTGRRLGKASVSAAWLVSAATNDARCRRCLAPSSHQSLTCSQWPAAETSVIGRLRHWRSDTVRVHVLGQIRHFGGAVLFQFHGHGKNLFNSVMDRAVRIDFFATRVLCRTFYRVLGYSTDTLATLLTIGWLRTNWHLVAHSHM